MNILRCLLLLLIICKVSHSNTTPLDTLTEFARRFWTTMATVARDDSRLKREDDDSKVENIGNTTLVDAVIEKSTIVDVDIAEPTTVPDSNIFTTAAPDVLREGLQGTLQKKSNRTGMVSAVVGKRKTLTTVRPRLRPQLRGEQITSTTCNDTSITPTPEIITERETEVFTISQSPHSLSAVQKQQTKPKLFAFSGSRAVVANSSKAVTRPSTFKTPLNVTSSPLANDSLSSSAVASLIKAITTAMVVVSEKLDSKLDSVVAVRQNQNDSNQHVIQFELNDLASLPLVENLQAQAKYGVRNAMINISRPVLVSINNSRQREQLVEDAVLTVEHVIDDIDDNVKLDSTHPTRPPIKNETEEVGECFFDMSDRGKMCNWSFTSSTAIKWSFGLGETAYMQGGPIRDSNGRIFGGYAFIDTSTGSVGNSAEIQRAEMISPKLEKTSPSGRCFTFWYNFGGLSADRLRVLLVEESDFENVNKFSRLPPYSVLWERKDSTNNTWTKGELLYTFGRPHRLVFEGFARSGSDHRKKFQGFIAVDDLAVDSDSCKAFCTFEGITCGWENEDSNDIFDWKLGRGSLSYLTGPLRDHGDGPEGGYMFVDSSYPRKPGDFARFKSPILSPTAVGPTCFKFWTHMYGSGIGTLKVIHKSEENSNEKVIWEVTGESGNLWHLAQVTVSSLVEYKIILEGVVGRDFLGNIAIDDISFGPGPCPSSPQTALPSRGDCTFEADECGWINAGSGDQYDWIRATPNQPIVSGPNANTEYKVSEPLVDHTIGLNSGYMLTMERSNVPPRAGDQAYIVGPTLHGSAEGRCFSFYAYMNERVIDKSGPGLGSLQVYLRVGSSPILRPIWRLINYEHPDWFFSQVPITTTEEFQIVVSGTWGSTRHGTISIDDFTFYDGNCSVIPAEAKVMHGECTFDSNMCEWVNTVDNKDLSVWQLSTANRRPATLDDHTYRATSGYVFFDIFSQHPHIVRLESPELIVDNSTLESGDSIDLCLTFWFAPFGSSNRQTFLKIYQKNLESDEELNVWEVTSANFQVFRPEWIYGQVALTNFTRHKLIFEGSSNNGGFAVDDIMFVPGNCQSRAFNL